MRKNHVLTFWTFDTVHPGHEYYLRKAKSFWDILITIIATDENVKKFKWKFPADNEQKRQENVKILGISDEVIIGKWTDPLRWLELYSPKVICLWYDQIWFSDTLEKHISKNNLKIKVVRIESFKADIYKSSLIKARIIAEDK